MDSGFLPGAEIRGDRFFKGGTDGVFGRESYKIQGINYDPGINYGAWGIAFGIKII